MLCVNSLAFMMILEDEDRNESPRELQVAISVVIILANVEIVGTVVSGLGGADGGRGKDGGVEMVTRRISHGSEPAASDSTKVPRPGSGSSLV